MIFSICSSDAPQPSSATVIMFPACMVVNTVLLNMTERSNNGIYFVNAGIATHTQGYSFILPPLFVFREAGLIFLSAIPMLAFFWLLSVCIRTPIFSIGIGLASIVPSVLAINTKLWFAYPMAYPFFVMTSEYGRLASNLSTAPIELVPFIPVAAAVTVICFFISCRCFGQA